jgi:hypothetical protein
VTAPRERSLESRIAEHGKYLRQCRQRIRNSVILAVMATLVCGYSIFVARSGIGYAIGVWVFITFFALMEVFSFHRHKCAIARLRALMPVSGGAGG